MAELVQCEDCGAIVPESEATFESYPGATLAFCASCAEKPPGAKNGFGRCA